MRTPARIALLAVALAAVPSIAMADDAAPVPHGRAQMSMTPADSEAALERARATGDKEAEADALAKLGSVYLISGRYGEGIRALRSSADLYHRLGNDETARKLHKMVEMFDARQPGHAEHAAP
jgi:hypothetical protein